jgi:beta-amylase
MRQVFSPSILLGLLSTLLLLLEPSEGLSCGSVPTFVMLPLDTVTNGGELKNKAKLLQQMSELKNASVTGVMVDLWFGVVEVQAKQYLWKPYQELSDMAQTLGLKMQVIMSFHECGGNVGDACNIPLPPWVLEKDGIWYMDQQGNENKEYISLFADHEPVFDGRTPAQVYSDYIMSFASTFEKHLGSTILEVQVSLGPAGELRYPAYPLSRWQYCGVGEFQCFDHHALASFTNASAEAGHPEWNSPPTNAGKYSDRLSPASTPFFYDGGYNSPYGRFFLKWYSESLLQHGSDILSNARKFLPPSTGVKVAAKIAGIHWWYKSASHAAELTAGYYNTDGQDAYAAISEMLSHAEVSLDFTCLEMQDDEQDPSCECGPFELVQQVERASFSNQVLFSGENALPRYDQTAYNTIESQSCYQGQPIESFTYLRLSDELLTNPTNLNTFQSFVENMVGGR